MAANQPRVRLHANGEAHLIAPNLMMVASYAEINSGKLLAELDEVIGECAEQLHTYSERTNDKRGKATVTIKLEIGYDPEYDGHGTIVQKIAKGFPATKRKVLVTFAGGRILIDATDKNLQGRAVRAVQQIDLFTDLGEIVGVADPASGTMEKVEYPPKAKPPKTA